MLVQQHLDVIEQDPPATPFRPLRQMLPQVFAQCLLGHGESGQRRITRQAQVPVIRRGNFQLHAGFIEHRSQRLGQRLRLVHAQLHLTAGQQAHAVHVGLHPGRIGRQPGGVRRIAGEKLAGDRCGGHAGVDAREAIAQTAQVADAAIRQAVGTGQPFAQRMGWLEMRQRGQPQLQRLLRRGHA